VMWQIVPCAKRIKRIDGTRKMHQNSPDDVRLRAADQIEQDGLCSGTAELDARTRKLGPIPE